MRSGAAFPQVLHGIIEMPSGRGQGKRQKVEKAEELDEVEEVTKH
jgi:hypothetical protein